MNQLRVTVCVLALCTSVATAFLPPTATTSTAGTTATTHGPTATTTALFDKKKQPSRAKPKGFAGALRDLQLTTFQYAGGIRPGTQSPQKKVNINTIVKPDYSEDGLVCILLSCTPILVPFTYRIDRYCDDIVLSSLHRLDSSLITLSTLFTHTACTTYNNKRIS
jgi:hypothetical protein